MNSKKEKQDSMFICIPKVNKNIPNEFIKRLMIELDIGYIYSIIENNLKTNNTEFKRILIKLNWKTEQLTSKDSIYAKLKKGETISYVYGNIEQMNFEYFRLVANHPRDTSCLSNTRLTLDSMNDDSEHV